MKLVLDTDVLVSGLISSTGASRRLLVLLNAGAFEILASVAMMLEYEAVLKRPEKLLATRLTVDEIDEFLSSFAMLVRPVTPFFLWRPVLKDPADEHILEAAINGRAEAIVTFNTKHFGPASRFGIDVVKPGEALGRIRR